jgi:hypothetical protein
MTDAEKGVRTRVSPPAQQKVEQGFLPTQRASWLSHNLGPICLSTETNPLRSTSTPPLTSPNAKICQSGGLHKEPGLEEPLMRCPACPFVQMFPCLRYEVYYR